MRMNKFVIFYVFSILLGAFMLIIYSAFKDIDINLSLKLDRVKVDYTRLKHLEEKVEELEREVSRLKLKPVSKDEAFGILLGEADKLIKLYDAVITNSLKEGNGYYTISLGFYYYPENAEDLLDFTNSFSKKRKPILQIEKFDFENLKNGTRVYFRIKLIQPFLVEK